MSIFSDIDAERDRAIVSRLIGRMKETLDQIYTSQDTLFIEDVKHILDTLNEQCQDSIVE